MELENILLNLFENSPVFVMLIGCPGSGKSTFASHMKDLSEDLIVINPDDIRETITGDRTNQENNYEVFSMAYSMINEYTTDGCNIIYDATNTVQKFREKAIRVAKRNNALVVGIIFDTKLRECIIRNEQRECVVPYNVLERMFINLKVKKPSVSEGFDILINYVIDE